MECYKTTVGDLAFAISSIANKAYESHTGDTQFDVDAKGNKIPGAYSQKKIYSEFLDLYSEYFKNGQLNKELSGLLLGETPKEGEDFDYETDLLIGAFEKIDNAIGIVKKLDPKASKSATSHRFTEAANMIAKDVFQKYVDNHPTEISTDGQSELGELGEVPEPTAKQGNEDAPVTLRALLKKLLSGPNAKYADAISDHLSHVVVSTWVDSRVDAETGKAKGFSGLTDTAIRVKAKLLDRIYNYFAVRADGTFDRINEDNATTHYLVYTPDRVPKGFIKDSKLSNDTILVGKQEDFSKLISTEEDKIGTVEDVKMIIAPDLDSAKAYIKEKTPGIIHDGENGSSKIDSTNFTEIPLTNPDEIAKDNEEDLPVFFAHILTNGSNYESFLDYKFKPLAKAYRDRYKISYDDENVVSGDDQDSAAQKMHKQSTPRLKVLADGKTLVVDLEHENGPYLTSEDFLMAAEKMPKVGADLPSMAKAIEDLSKTDERAYMKGVYASIFHRFFKEGDYIVNGVMNPTTGKTEDRVTMRSYRGIVDAQKANTMSVDEYTKTKDRANIPMSFNAALEDSLSSIVTSLRSIVINNQFSVRNDVGQTTNIEGKGATVDGFNTNFIESTSDGSAIGAKTKSTLLSKIKEVKKVTGVNTNTGGPRIQITIEGPDGGILTYQADVNIKPAGEGQSFAEFKDGIPLTIVNKSKDIVGNQLSDIFAQFKLPNVLTNPRFNDTIHNSLSSADLQNQKNKGQINTAFGSADVTTDNLYLNMLFTMLLNGSTKIESVNNLYNAIGSGNLPEPGKEIPYSPTTIMYGYKKAISDIMQRTIGEYSKGYQTKFNGDKVATNTSNSAMKRTGELVERITPESIHYMNPLTPANRLYKVGPQTYVKSELKLGDDVKSMGDFTENENAHILIECAFLQQAKKSRGHSTVLIQIGEQADRLHPQLTQFEATETDGIFMRNTTKSKVDGWEPKLWVGDANKLLVPKNTPFTVDMLASVKNHAQLKIVLDKTNVPYDFIKTNAPELLDYARIREDAAGRAYIPKESTSNPTGLDTHALARRLLNVHQNYYKGLDKVTTAEWNNALGTSFNNLQEVADHLKTNPTPHEVLKAESGLRDMAQISKVSGVDAEGKKVDYARVPEDVLQSIKLFSNDTLGLDYIESMRKMFRNQLDAAGYRQISNSSVKAMAENIMVNKTLTEPTARDILFDAYFYNSQILGVSALNIHTGGIEQYDQKGGTLFDAKSSFENGRLDTKSILGQAVNLKVPGSDKTLGTISVDELLAIRDSNPSPLIERLAHMKIVLDNNDAFPTELDKAKALIYNDFTRHTGEKFVSQIKRNAPLGSAMQLPRIAGEHEPGMFIGKASNNVTVVDDRKLVKAIGSSGGGEVVTTDGVVEVHDLVAIMVNNSLGNNESSFKMDGCAAKNLTIYNDSKGFTEDQKKAEFQLMSNDLLKKGAPLNELKLKKMNEAVEFPSKVILVDSKGNLTDKSWTPVDLQSWKTHGLSYGYLKYIAPDQTVSMIHANNIWQKLKTGEFAVKEFEEELARGQYSTAKIAKTFNNMQELWEYHGATSNKQAWHTIADILGYHSGNATTRTDLADAIYPNRHAFIEKMSYTSQEKTGARNTISFANMINPNYKLTSETGVKRYTPVGNDHHGFILQPEHNYDTTSSHNKTRSADNKEIHDNMVSLITQIISACSFEGVSDVETGHINNTIGTLTKAALDGLRNRIVSRVLKSNPDIGVDKKYLLDKLKSGSIGTSDAELKLKDAIQDYARELVTSSLSKQQNDPGLAMELLSNMHKGSLTFDQKQLLPLVQSQIFADFNSKTVRMKFAGGQFVVSPSHVFLPTYELKDGLGNTILSGMTREDMNNNFYGSNFNKLDKVQRDAITNSYPLQPVTDINKVMLSDMILAQGKLRPFIDIKNDLRGQYTGDPKLFDKHVEDVLKSNDYRYRFSNLTSTDEKPLKWIDVERYDAKDGTRSGIMDTEEFKAFDAVGLIAKDYAKGVPYHKTFGLDAKNHGKAKLHPSINVDTKLKVPLGLVKEYYFNVVDPKGTTMLSTEDIKNFNNWYFKENGMQLAEKVHKFVGEYSNTVKSNTKENLYNLLQDETKGWVPTESEMYMPHMHASAFLLHTGEDGTRADSLMDLTGFKTLPSTNKLESLGILSHQEAIDHTFNFIKSRDKFKESGKYDGLELGAKGFYDDYEDSVIQINKKLADVFQKRVADVYKRYVSSDKYDGTASKLFVFSKMDLNTLENEAMTRRNSATVGSTHYEVMSNIVKRARDAKELIRLGQKNLAESPSKIFNDEYTSFVNGKASILTDNFLKTLEFITARIPAQGKSYFTKGKIKNFIFSSKNSVYGPLELILLAGLDYDIDKQNMMTWSVDKDAKIIPWQDYMDDNGKLSIVKLTTRISNDESTIRSNFGETIQSLEDQLTKETTERDAPNFPTNGEEATAKSDKIVNLQNRIASTKVAMEKAVEVSDMTNRTRFAQAGQNFIVHNLMEVISSPKNAIEASTTSSMDKPKSAIQTMNIRDLFKGKLGVEDLFASQQITNNFNPFSTIQYEKITMAGKSSIGIFASDLKAYAAAFYATRTATADEQQHVSIPTDLKRLPDKYNDKFNIDKTGLQFFKAKLGEQWNPSESYTTGATIKKGRYSYTAVQDVPKGIAIPNEAYWKIDSEVITNKVLANAYRWTTDGQRISTNARKGIEALKAAKDATPEAQAAIIQQYIGDVKKFNSMNVGDQAWEDLSQLLSAATDNAKELILGKIGANNTTNSLISTMVRMGVGLKDSLQLINDPTIKSIVKEIEDESDLYFKQANIRSDTAAGKIYQEKYAEKLIDKLKSAQPKTVLGETMSDEQVFDYLTDPARVLYTYAKQALEYSSLSKHLSLNQGLKNSAYEVFSYVDSIDKSMNKAITLYNEENPEDKVDLPDGYSVKQFVSDVVNGNKEQVTKVLNAFDKIRTGINVPFTFFKNEHYFSYFESMFQAKQIRDNLSYVNSHIEEVVDRVKTRYKEEKHITLPMYNRIADTLYAFGILDYLGKEAGGNNAITLMGRKYDLSLAQSDGAVGGRFEFMNDVPKALSTISNNDFVDSLTYNKSKKDKLTGVSFKRLRGLNLDLVPSDKFAQIRSGLEKLRDNGDGLHRALFLYDLISTKAAYGGGSFMGLFNIEDYLKFSNHLKENAGDIFSQIDANTELITALNPLLLPQVRTVPKTGSDSKIPGGDYNEGYDIQQELDNEGYDNPEGNDRSFNRDDLSKYNFIADDLNRYRRDPKNIASKHDLIRSKSNDLTYLWNDTLGIYMPLTRRVPEEVVQFSLPKTNITSIPGLDATMKSSGFIPGFAANMSELDINARDENGNRIAKYRKGTIITYISEGMKNDVNPKDGIPTANQELINLLMDNKEKVFRENSPTYLVKYDNDGHFGVESASDLLLANPEFKLDEGNIQPGSKEFDYETTAAVPERRFYQRLDGSYSTIEGQGQPIDKKINRIANGNTSSVYDADSIKKLISLTPIGKLDRVYDATMVDTQYKSYTDQLLEDLLVSTYSNTNIEKAQYMSKNFPNLVTPQDVAIVNQLKGRITEILGESPSTVFKLTVLSEGLDGFNRLYNRINTSGKNIPTTPAIDYPRKDTIPVAALDTVAKYNSSTKKYELDPTIARDNITRMPTTELRMLYKLLDISEDAFKAYVNSVLMPEIKVDALILPGEAFLYDGGEESDKAYLSKGTKISMSRELTDLNKDIENSKPIYVPASMRYEYIKPANKEVMFALARHLNEILPGVKWRILTTDQIADRYGNKYNTAKGFFKSNGEVIINIDKATLETPIHEFGHVYLQYLAKETPTEYQRIMALAKDHPLFDTMKKSYTGLSDTDVAEETFNELLSMSATEQLMLGKSDKTREILNSVSDVSGRFGKIINVIKSIFQKFFGKKADIQLGITDSLKSVIDKLSDDILYGTDSMLNKFSDETKQAIAKSRNGATLDIKDAKEALQSRGYIQWYCV